MVNDQFDSVRVQELFSTVPLTMERGRFYVMQNALYTSNRRDCWGYVQGAAPLEVKRVIWEHESDELINDPRAGMDHYTLTVKQGEVIGLNPRISSKAEVPAMVQILFLCLAPYCYARSLADGLHRFAYARAPKQRKDRQGRRDVFSGRQKI